MSNITKAPVTQSYDALPATTQFVFANAYIDMVGSKRVIDADKVTMFHLYHPKTMQRKAGIWVEYRNLNKDTIHPISDKPGYYIIDGFSKDDTIFFLLIDNIAVDKECQTSLPLAGLHYPASSRNWQSWILDFRWYYYVEDWITTEVFATGIITDASFNQLENMI